MNRPMGLLTDGPILRKPRYVGPEGFHVIIENLTASPTWRSRHIAPGDMNSLYRRWLKAVFRTMRQRAKDVERLCRLARHRPERAFQHSQPGFFWICQEQIGSALNVHMMNVHLELGHGGCQTVPRVQMPFGA